MTAHDGALPKHVALIMDGNGRWAQSRMLPRVYGHRKGAESLEAIIRHAHARGIAVLTVFALSTENMHRPKTEVTDLLHLFVKALHDKKQLFIEHNIRFCVIGDRSVFPDTLQSVIATTETETQRNTALTIVVAANFGGRWDITQAVTRAAQNGCPERFTDYLSLARIIPKDMQSPDLFIRTGGEQRISNFLLWDLAYSELYFTDTCWPDFDADAFDTALTFFRQRQRRFGKTSAQLQTQQSA